jgi:cytochrome c-type biogenesis protein CcmI
MEIVLALVVLVVLAAFVIAPLRRRAAEPGEERGEDPERADLEARKEALYRQIRDAELDREQGKLSAADWKRLDAELRREAIAVLKRIDAVRERGL